MHCRISKEWDLKMTVEENEWKWKVNEKEMKLIDNEIDHKLHVHLHVVWKMMLVDSKNVTIVQCMHMCTVANPSYKSY